RYYAISSVDSNTEWMLDLGEFVETDATKKGKLSRYVVDIFRGYLIDEMNLIDDSAQRIESNKTLRNATEKGTKRSAKNLKFMYQILYKTNSEKVKKFLSNENRTTSNEDYVYNSMDIGKYVNAFFSKQTMEVRDALVE